MTGDVSIDGFAVQHAVVAPEQLTSLLTQVEPLRARGESEAGMRLLLQRSEAVRHFAYSDKLSSLARSALGEGVPKPVRAILFDKTPSSNWYVTWHQDVTIAVKERIDVAGYGPWSIKSGVHHVQPPAAVLQNMAFSIRNRSPNCAHNASLWRFQPRPATSF